MTAYYAAHVHDDTVLIKSGPHETHDDAMLTHVDAARRGELRPVGPSGYWKHAVLLDTGSVQITDTAALMAMLQTDPLLHAIFQLGRNLERAKP